MELWNEKTEFKFFEEASSFASPEQLFYITEDNGFIAYWPKGYKGTKSTLQSRNSLIGSFTERWTRDIIQTCVEQRGLYAIQGAICPEITLTNKSPGDVVIAKKNRKLLSPEDILIIFEVKMSLVWNWKIGQDEELQCTGDYKTHQGNPGLLRSDSMLKAIGKSMNIRASGFQSSNIPIIVIGNTPITNHYIEKVDNLKNYGIIQGFWSINPKPSQTQDYIETTRHGGFQTITNFNIFQQVILELLDLKLNFFSGMESACNIGKMIEIANRESNYEKKAEVFLSLLRGE